MLVGSAGTGKSVIVGDKLSLLDSEQYLVKNVPFNYYTTSAMLQGKSVGKMAGLRLKRQLLKCGSMNSGTKLH